MLIDIQTGLSFHFEIVIFTYKFKLERYIFIVRFQSKYISDVI